MAKVTIDESACVGCGLCVNACSTVFELSEDGVAKVKAHECSDCDLKDIASQCPVNCITVED
ncbi:MAG: ferredoxin [Candidatus Omnitrophica bacterium]|nr:ferredoxin [Candidatus Omnitrophota bacterium]